MSFHIGSSVHPYNKIDYFERRDLFSLDFEGTDEEVKHFKSEYTTSTFFLNLDLMVFFFDSIGISAKYRNIKTEYHNYKGFLRPLNDVFQFNINSYHFFSIGVKYRFLIPFATKNTDSAISFLVELDGGITTFSEYVSEDLKQEEGFFFTPESKIGYIAGIHFGILISSTLSITVGIEAISLHFAPRKKDFLAWIFPLSFSAKVF